MQAILKFSIKMSESMKTGTASFKAPADILKIAKSHGFEEYVINVDYRYGIVFRVMNCIWQLTKFKKLLPKESTVLYQYPDFHPLFMLFTIYLLNLRAVALIHDINSIRNKGCISWYEKKLLNRFETLIVHTSNMKEFLYNVCNINRPNYYVLGAFPYLAKSDKQKRKNEPSICFPGNIDKSQFLKEFFALNNKIDINLYGNMKETNISSFPHVHYHGFFKPDNVLNIVGSWGLVWDGDTVDTCSGKMGNYHTIIAPHKFSLFMVAGFPVIVWKKSAMSVLVNQRGLGITVESISDLYSVLRSISDEKYIQYQTNVWKFADEVITSGRNFNDILNSL